MCVCSIVHSHARHDCIRHEFPTSLCVPICSPAHCILIIIEASPGANRRPHCAYVMTMAWLLMHDKECTQMPRKTASPYRTLSHLREHNFIASLMTLPCALSNECGLAATAIGARFSRPWQIAQARRVCTAAGNLLCHVARKQCVCVTHTHGVTVTHTHGVTCQCNRQFGLIASKRCAFVGWCFCQKGMQCIS